MASDPPKLNLILEKNLAGKFDLWACRGEGRGCNRNRYRSAAKHCADCVATHDGETLGELADRLARGDG